MLFQAYEAALKAAGFLAMGGACQGSGDAQHRWKAGGGGQIVDASIIAAPKQRNTEGEKAEIKAGRIPEAWAEKPAKLAQKSLPSGLTRGTATRAGR